MLAAEYQGVKMKSKIISWVFMFMVLISLVTAAAITKSVSKTEVQSGDQIEVTLEVVSEASGNAEVQDLYPQFAIATGGPVVAGYAPHMFYELDLIANEKQTLKYSLKFQEIPATLSDKENSLGLATLTQNGNTFESNNPAITFSSISGAVSCNFNSVCDSFENYQTCLQDCKSGSADNYCDQKQEGTCDPDCTPEEDLDCKKPRSWSWLLIVLGLILVMGVIFIYLKRRN